MWLNIEKNLIEKANHRWHNVTPIMQNILKIEKEEVDMTVEEQKLSLS